MPCSVLVYCVGFNLLCSTCYIIWHIQSKSGCWCWGYLWGTDDIASTDNPDSDVEVDVDEAVQDKTNNSQKKDKLHALLTWSLSNLRRQTKMMVTPQWSVAMVRGTADFPEPVLEIRYMTVSSLNAPWFTGMAWRSHGLFMSQST